MYVQKSKVRTYLSHISVEERAFIQSIELWISTDSMENIFQGSLEDNKIFNYSRIKPLPVWVSIPNMSAWELYSHGHRSSICSSQDMNDTDLCHWVNGWWCHHWVNGWWCHHWVNGWWCHHWVNGWRCALFRLIAFRPHSITEGSQDGVFRKLKAVS